MALPGGGGELSPEDQEKLDALPYKHLAMATIDNIIIDGTLATPSYFTGFSGVGSNSSGFIPTLTGVGGDEDTGAILNNTGRDLNMTGLINIEGDTQGFSSDVAVWSEFSTDGVNWTPQERSARVWPLSFSAAGSQSNFSGVVGWPSGSLLRFGLAIVSGADVDLEPASFTVNGSQIVEGFSVVWTLDEKVAE